MSRTGKIKKRKTIADPIYKSTLVTQFINVVMMQGKKSVAEKVVYQTLAELDPDPKKAVELFRRAVASVSPRQEVRSRRVGGATYQIPVPVVHARAQALALRWILEAARSRSGVPVSKKLTLEIQDVLNGVGAAIKKKDNTHRMAEANRAFAHFRW